MNYDLKGLLCKVCHDLENCEGAVSYFELPEYLKGFWAENKEQYYQENEKNKRYQKYLELKREFEKLAEEFKNKDINNIGLDKVIEERNQKKEFN